MPGWGDDPWGEFPWGGSSFVPTRPPPVDVPTYEYVVKIKAFDGGAIDEFQAKNLVFSYILNASGSVSFYLPLHDPKALKSTLIAGQREVQVYRDNKRVWGGYLWTLSSAAGSEGEPLVRVGGEGYFSKLNKRYIDTTQTFTAQDQFNIAWGLINTAQAKTNGNFGITRGTEANSGVLRDRTYNDYERKNLGEAIIDMTNLDNGFDIDLDANKVFHMYYPQKGSTIPVVTFDLNKNIRGLSWDVDATDIANEVTSLGSGQGASQLLGIDTDTTSQGQYQLMETTTSYIDVSIQATLDDHAQADVDLMKDAHDNPQMSVLLTSDVAFDSFTVGDTVRVVVETGFISINKSYRIATKTVAVADTGLEAIGVFFA
jgi:hypothetical protein